MVQSDRVSHFVGRGFCDVFFIVCELLGEDKTGGICVPVKSPYVRDPSRAGAIKVRRADDYPDAVIVIVRRSFAEPFYARVLRRDVYLEWSIILGNPLPHVLDVFQLRCVEA